MNTETSLISFSSKIQQLEERQNITAKYTVGVKRQLDELTGKFNELQQRFEKQLTLNNSLNGTKPINGLALNVSEVNADNAANKIDPAETDAIDQQEQSIPVFSDEEFKTLRLTQVLGAYGDMLLLTAYLAEEKTQDIPLSSEEFWKQYKDGKRDFTGVNLAGVNLDRCAAQASWSNANLHKANLSKACLQKAELVHANLSEVNLVQADLSYANLTAVDMRKANLNNTKINNATFLGAQMTGAILIGVNFQGWNFSSVNLSETNLCGANLIGINLSGCNLTSADLCAANLSKANLEKANLKDANLDGAILDKAKLTGAIMPDGTTHE